ncbi:MBL fold hydrolase [soil metagenome]
MKITRFGHAALLVELADTRIVIDPGGFSLPEVFTLTDIDVIAVTHQHGDHADLTRLPTLLAANPGAVLLAEPEIREQLIALGGDWKATAVGETTTVGDVVLTGVGGRHAVIYPEMAGIGNIGLLIKAPGSPTLFHPGDSYEYVPDGVDVLAVPLSAPWAKISETVEFVRAVSPSTVFPIHDCTIAEVAYWGYWLRIEEFGDVENTVLLPQDGSLTLPS